MTVLATLKKKGANKYLVEFVPAQVDSELDDVREWCAEMYAFAGEILEDKTWKDFRLD
jgi:hypothetical protein